MEPRTGKGDLLFKHSLSDIANASGWGVQTSPYWFFGLEPYGDWAMSWEPQPPKTIRSPFTVDTDGKTIRTPTWQIAAKIVAAMERKDWKEDWRAIWLKLNEHVYWDNIQPLPRLKFGSFSGQYEKVVLNGLNFSDDDSYLKALLPLRREHFKTLMAQTEADRYVFCFGKSLRGDYLAAFGIDARSLGEGDVKTVKKGRTTFLFLPFFSYRFINQGNLKIETIVEAALGG